jgi:hypothetical protein
MKQNIQDKLNEINEARQNYKALMQEHGAALVQEMANGIFNAFPCVRAVQWTQYTPYFNDGDLCYFSVNEALIALNEDFVESLQASEKQCLYDHHDDFVSFSYRLDDHPNTSAVQVLKKIKEALEEFQGVLNNLSEAMEETFGDH